MKTIAMSGCFDMFHDGHKHILRTALDLVDTYNDAMNLVICINTDESVKELKGSDRPINSLKERSNAVYEYCEYYNPHATVVIFPFKNEKMLADFYDIWKPNAILHGDDIRDVHKVTGFPKYPVLIVDRGYDKYGERTSTTRLIEERDE